jgi:hypothetical protein
LVKRVPDDFSGPEVVAALRGCDAVVCCMGGAHVSQQLPLIDAAVAAGVKWFVPAEFGSNKLAAKDGPQSPHNNFIHAKKEVVLKRLAAAEKEGLSWTALSTGAFLDW